MISGVSVTKVVLDVGKSHLASMAILSHSVPSLKTGKVHMKTADLACPLSLPKYHLTFII